MENNDRSYTEGIKVEGKIPRRLDNFWYHYKWHTIIIAFVLVVLLVCTFQMCSREKEDTTILYGGPAYLSHEQMSDIERIFEAVMPDDFDGNGEKSAALTSFLIYTKEQIEEIEAETDEDGYPLDVDNSVITQNSENFYDYIMTGESSVCLLDPSLYEALRASERLAELWDNVYGISLGETELYETYSALRLLPEDTVVCMLRKSIIVKDETYENDRKMLDAILGFTKDE